MLDNLHRIVVRRMASGRLSPHIDGENCHQQINSLTAKKLIVLHIEHGTESVGYRWERVGLGPRSNPTTLYAVAGHVGLRASSSELAKAIELGG